MSTHVRWLLPQIDPSQAQFLATALDVHAPVARVLVRRGYADPKRASQFLNPSLDGLHDPFLLAGMREAVARLLEAIRRDQPILLYGDYDADGITSVVVLHKAIERAGGRVSFHVPHRLKEGYGLHAEAVQQAAASGVKLLISVDTGIRAAQAVAEASRLGIDVIVTDHHMPEAELPAACAVLNPKRPDCPYPEKNLSGAGVAFKLVEAMLRELGWPSERQRRMLDSLLKLVAIGTIADVVPLTGENRILVKHGLRGLGSVRNPGLRALLDVAGFGEGEAPTATQVAFRVAPRMNAAGRMASASDVIELFLTGDAEHARTLAARFHQLNQERQVAETEIVQAILEECERIPVTEGQKALVFAGRSWHRGVAGIAASRVADRFHRPTVVLSEDPDTGLAHGSGRSIAAFHLLEALESMPELFVRFGGHRQAVGLTLPTERVAQFRERLNSLAGSLLTDDDLAPTVEIDAGLDLSEIDDVAVQEILSLAPFGFGNPSPVFAVFGAEVASSPVVWKDKHLLVRIGHLGRTLSAKAWNMAPRAGELQPGSRVDVALCFEEDRYSLRRGYGGWGAVVRDIRPVP